MSSMLSRRCGSFVQEIAADGATAVARAVTLAAAIARIRATGRACHPDIGPPQSR